MVSVQHRVHLQVSSYKMVIYFYSHSDVRMVIGECFFYLNSITVADRHNTFFRASDLSQQVQVRHNNVIWMHYFYLINHNYSDCHRYFNTRRDVFQHIKRNHFHVMHVTLLVVGPMLHILIGIGY